jgi:hypothetical protein
LNLNLYENKIDYADVILYFGGAINIRVSTTVSTQENFQNLKSQKYAIFCASSRLRTMVEAI